MNRKRWKDYRKFVQEPRNLIIAGGLATVVCIAWFIAVARPWDPEMRAEFDLNLEFAFASVTELIIIWITVFVVYFLLEGRKKREREPVYRAVFRDAHVVYRKIFVWIYAVMREGFANAERNALREHKRFPRVDQRYRLEDSCPPMSLSSRKAIFLFVREYRKEPIIVSRRGFERQLDDIEKDVEHLLQTHSAFLASDATELQGSDLISQFSDLRTQLRNLQLFLRYGETEATDVIELNLRRERKEGVGFTVKIGKEESDEIQLGFLKILSKGLRNLYEKSENGGESAPNEHYCGKQLKCQTISALVDVLAEQDGQGDSVPSEVEPGETGGRQRIQSVYPKSLKYVHELVAAQDPKLQATQTAQYNLGIIICEFGKAKSEDESALDNFKALADDQDACGQDGASACFHIGLLYREGRGVEIDLREAKVWFEKAADLGHKDAQFVLGLVYLGGRGVMKDSREAEKWFERAAGPSDQDFRRNKPREGAEANRRVLDLVGVYRKGRSERERLLAEHEWYGRTEQGHGEAQFILGEMHMADRLDETLDMFGLVRRPDFKIAMNRFLQATAQDHVDAQHHLGLVYWNSRVTEQGIERRKADAKAVECFRMAAKQGRSDAQYCLGLAYWERRGIEQGIYEAEADTKAVEFFRMAAEQKHASAQYLLGLAYWGRRGTEQGIDEAEADAKAVECFRTAAEQDHAEAQHHLGLAYREGRGVPRDREAVRLAAEWFRRAERQGHTCAQSGLGDVHRDADGVAKRIYENVEWLLHAADPVDADAMRRLLGVAIYGYPDAQYALGLEYWNGRITKQNDEEAVKWFLHAAEPGRDHVGAQYYLGIAYLEGRGVKEKDADNGVNWLRKAARQGHTDARNALGILWLQDRDKVEGIADAALHARTLLRRKTERGDLDARDRLGLIYLEGRGVEVDAFKALELFKHTATEKHAGGRFQLGTMYRDGLGVPRDYREAAKWFRKAAEQGYADAEFALGAAYRGGLGVAKDPCKAKELFRQAEMQGNTPAYYEHRKIQCKFSVTLQEESRFRRAAERGDADAAFALAIAYRDCSGEAKKLFLKAAAKGHVPAFLELWRMDREGSTVSPLKHGSPSAEPIETLQRERLVKSFRQAAKQGDADAEFALGVAYRDGFVVKKDRGEAKTWFRKAAKHGNARAYFELGGMAREDAGDGQEIDTELRHYRKSAEGGCGEAFEELQKRADKCGNSAARVALGEMYLKGLGVPRDYHMAAKWFRGAAELGVCDGEFQLGQMCRDGLGNPGSWEGVVATPGDPPRWNWTYRKGDGDPSDWEDPSTWTKHAIKWYCKAAGKGHSRAFCELSRIFGGFSSEPVEKWMSQREWRHEHFKATFKFPVQGPKGDREAEEPLPNGFLEQEKVEEKLGEMMKAMLQEGEYVENEHEVLQKELERMQSVAKSLQEERKELEDIQNILDEINREMPEDRQKGAFECFRRAAEQGGNDAEEQADAEFALGVAYRDGFGADKSNGSRAEAGKRFGMAAQRGHVPAYLELSRQNRNSIVMRRAVDDLDKVLREAVECFRRRAAASSDADAEFALGVAYRDGLGVKKSVPEAARWFSMAAQRGHVRAYCELAKITGV